MHVVVCLENDSKSRRSFSDRTERLLASNLAMLLNVPCSFPTDSVHVFLFKDLLNTAELKSRLVSGDPDYQYAFINAELVSQRVH
jgi:Kinase binding protein CGI-121